jgi:hypothetical protein
MPGNSAKARLVQDILICFLGLIIVADVYRATGGEHRNVEGGPSYKGPWTVTPDRYCSMRGSWSIMRGGLMVSATKRPPGFSCLPIA